MKRPYLNSKTMRVITALTASANLFTACGPNFTVNKAAFVRPPTTSNLYEAENETDLEAFKTNKAPSAPFLDSAEATRAFEEDIKGVPRTQTDEQLADVLEALHEKQVKEKDVTASGSDESDRSMPPAPLPTDRAPTHRESEAAKAQATSATPAGGVSLTKEASAPGPRSIRKSGGQREGQAPAPTATGLAADTSISPAKVTRGQLPNLPSVPGDGATPSAKMLEAMPWVPSVPTEAQIRRKKLLKQSIMSADTTPVSPGSPATPVKVGMPANPPLPPVQENKDNWQRVQQPASGTVSELRAARRAANPTGLIAVSRRDKVIQQISQNICDVVNVKSSVPEDLAYLYFDKKALPSKLPADTLQAQTGNAKENMFVCLLLPHAIRMDAQVYSQRLEVIRLQGRNRKGTITDDDNKWLSDLKRAYRMQDSGSFEELLARVDVVPLPLILTQAAFESEWGTSKGARITNNLFGMHSVDHTNCMPNFDTGGKSCLRNFRTVTEGVSMYIRLLDAGTYFGSFRQIRSQMRASGAKLDPVKLLAGMGAYSERGGHYISDVTAIMTRSSKIGKYELNEPQIREASADSGRPVVNK